MPVGGVELCSIRFRPVRSKSESDRIYIWTNVNTIIQLGDHIYKKRRIICALVDHYCVEGLGGHLVFRHHSVLNNASSISSLVELIRVHPLVSETIVVDDGSTDETASLAKASGANVILSSMLGKGASMHDGLMIANAENILFLDGNICSLSSSLIDSKVDPEIETAV
jgi:cellulose synthase/poly-beta-1,6-N-acetylglucosamine synthase-like glycosyltransferase